MLLRDALRRLALNVDTLLDTRAVPAIGGDRQRVSTLRTMRAINMNLFAGKQHEPLTWTIVVNFAFGVFFSPRGLPF